MLDALGQCDWPIDRADNIRQRFRQGETKVVNAMLKWAKLTDRVRNCLLKGEKEKIGALLNANFDQRRKIYRVSNENIEMIETARSTGASAKFTGSGGAIVGAYKNQVMFNELKKKLKKIKVRTIKPQIISFIR